VNRSAAGRLGGYESWARTPDRAARSARGYTGLLARFERQARERLGPHATDKAIADAADSLRKAHYARLSAAGVAARQAS